MKATPRTGRGVNQGSRAKLKVVIAVLLHPLSMEMFAEMMPALSACFWVGGTMKSILILSGIAALLFSAPVYARGGLRPPKIGVSMCVSSCKEPWKMCFRDACYKLPGFENMQGAKRAQVEKIAEKKCSGEWASFQQCKSKCDQDSNAAPRLFSQHVALASGAIGLCSIN